MFAKAKRRIYIIAPYLASNDSMVPALANTAKSSVDVRILIPDKKDHVFLFWNNTTYSNALMKTGVRIWRHKDGSSMRK